MIILISIAQFRQTFNENVGPVRDHERGVLRIKLKRRCNTIYLNISFDKSIKKAKENK
jgi:hypothetical protein